jgi:hypothetical protein
MAQYRLYFLNDAGRLIRRESISAGSNEEAIAIVDWSPLQAPVMELWIGGELVKRLAVSRGAGAPPGG